ncbi:hypothetical protein FQA39_LY01212 [Lamprigera yunnana]|nr:hypothetical protein FQA39_LY01212 [Lamprigera yunnana]
MAGAMLFERSQVVNNRDKDLQTLINNEEEPENEEEKIKNQEQDILNKGEQYKKEGKAQELAELIKGTRPFLGLISKAKAAKLVRSLVDFFLDLEAGIGIEVQLCKECIEWAKEERRTFLRQSLEARLVALYFDTGMYTEALQLGSTLLKELKKLDDKNLLVEVQLLESKTYHALSNLPKARAALTSARTTANAIYCPPKMQAALDLQSGILHAADEKDFKTAYSYFYEAFEGFDSVESPKALTALKYMLLSKIMLNNPEDVQQIVSGKLAIKYAGRDIDAMKSVAQASHKRSLADFQQAVKQYKHELEDDVIVRAHLGTLYDNMLEQNLCRIIEPYSRVQVDYIARTIKLPMPQVEKKLSQMILDTKFHGILDQGEGVLIVFENTPVDKTYEMALETIQSTMPKKRNTVMSKDKLVEEKPVYVVEKIINKRYDEVRGTEYLLKWKGYTVEESTWEPERNLNCPELVAAYEAQLKNEYRHLKRKNVTNGTDEQKRPRKVIGFARGLKPKEILAATNSSGQLLLLMKWDNSDKVDLVPAVEANLRCPEIVIDFYEKHTVLIKDKDDEIIDTLNRTLPTMYFTQALKGFKYLRHLSLRLTGNIGNSNQMNEFDKDTEICSIPR